MGLLPLLDHIYGSDGDGINGANPAAPCIFGVSGYSGAGTTPSEKNDTRVLSDNLLPYALGGHIHEREVGHQLGLGAKGVRFSPHVAPFFQGIFFVYGLTSVQVKRKCMSLFVTNINHLIRVL